MFYLNLLLPILLLITCISYGDEDVMDVNNDDTITTLHEAFAEFDIDNISIALDGNQVIIETNGLPNHTSPYWSNSNERCLQTPMGTEHCSNEDVTKDHPLFVAPIVTSYDQMAPGNIDNFNGSFTLIVDANPSLASSSTATGLGPTGICKRLCNL